MVTTLFRVIKSHGMAEPLKLEFLKVGGRDLGEALVLDRGGALGRGGGGIV